MSKKTSGAPILKRIFVNSCITYTVIVLFLCLILLLISEDLGKAVSPQSFLLVFPFSVCIAIANDIDKNAKFAQFYKSLIHTVLTIGSFFCFLYFPAFQDAKDSNFFVVLLVFSVAYFMVYGLTLLFRHRINKEFRQDAEYTPQFSAKDSSKK